MSRMTLKAWLALWSVYVIWGSTYLAIAYAIETMPPLLMAGTRFLLAGVVMYAIGVRRGDRANDPLGKPQWVAAGVVGIALCLGGNGLVTLAEQRVPSGVAALIVATIPLWIAAFEWLRFRAKLERAAVVGLLIGFAGVALLVLPRGAEGTDPLGGLMLLGAACSWSAGSLYARRAPLPARPVVGTGMEMIVGGLALLLVGTVAGEWPRVELSQISGRSLAGLVYLIVFGSLIAFTAYVWLLRNVKTSIVATYAYVNPVVAIALGWFFRDERLAPMTVFAALVIIAAVAVIVMASGGGARTPGEASPTDRPDLSTENVAG